MVHSFHKDKAVSGPTQRAQLMISASAGEDHIEIEVIIDLPCALLGCFDERGGNCR